MTREEHELVRRYLDGELAYDALPPALRAQADAFERLFTPLRRQRVGVPPSLGTAVMRRVRWLSRPVWQRAVAWTFQPRAVRLRPATGFLALAAAVAIVLLARPDAPTPTATTTHGVITQFVFLAPAADSVAVTGDFAAWDPNGIPMERRSGGLWIAEVQLSAGVHHYVFIVDGTQWQPDPHATSQVDDGFGQANSVLLVPERRSS